MESSLATDWSAFGEDQLCRSIVLADSSLLASLDLPYRSRRAALLSVLPHRLGVWNQLKARLDVKRANGAKDTAVTY